MDARSSGHYKRRSSRDEKFTNGSNDNSSKSSLNEESQSNNSLVNGKTVNNRRPSYSSRHSTSSPEIMHSPIGSTLPFGDELCRRRSSSRSSASASPLPLSSNRRHSVGATESVANSNNNNNTGHSSSTSASTSSTGAMMIPSTKNVGVSVNLGKANVKSNSLSSAGAQHILPNGHQHQQHTPGTVTTASNTNIPNHNDNNNGNSVAINLGHGHIGTIAAPPSVSISCGGASTSVNHISSSSTMSPAVTAPTTCTNKGVPLNNQQQQHLPSPSPQPSNQPGISPNSQTLPMNHGLPEPQLQAGSAAENGKSSNSSSSSTSGSDGNCSNKKSNGGIRTGPNSPSSSSSTSSSGGSKGEAQPNPAKTGTDSTGSGNSSSDNNTNRIVSQNVNGTLAVTGVPSNDSELQLFRVLQRANLLSYFDMMIELGGDDVQQLCDAGEEEFLEIMALIGMASKPLHVRRLQKALQEWMTQPGLFQAPVLPPGYPLGSSTQPQQGLPQVASTVASGATQLPIPHMPSYSPGSGATNAVPVLFPGVPELIPTPSDMNGSANSSKLTNQIKSNGIHFPSANNNGSIGNPHANPFAAALALQQALANAESGMVYPPQLADIVNNLSPNNNHHQAHHQHQSRRNHNSTGHHHHTSNNKTSEKERMQIPSDIKIPADQLIPSHFLETRIRTRSEPSSSPGSSFAGSPHPDSRNSVSPVPLSLQDHEVQKLAETAIHLIRSLPPSVAEPKFSSKRKTSGDYELILRLADSDPRRMEEVRRVAAVYGRADAKRKTYKPLSMHELAINEGAAQLCKHVPALLTKREELLSLSRQVVRDSGLPYAALSSTFSISILTNSTNSANASTSIQSNNNNDINTKSKYEDINRHSSSSFNRDVPASPNGSNSFFSGFQAKRCRLDGSSAGIEIQEYNNGRSILSLQQSPSPPATSNGMQITELRSLPPRRSPSDDHLPSPLELVTVTTSEFRRNGVCTGGAAGIGSKSSISSMESNSPPIRRPYSVESADDLTTSSRNPHHHQPHHGIRSQHHTLNTLPSVKITSIPVSGGSISIMNHNGSGSSLHNQQFGSHRLHHHHHHHPYNGSQHHRLPIKSEPAVNT